MVTFFKKLPRRVIWGPFKTDADERRKKRQITISSSDIYCKFTDSKAAHFCFFCREARETHVTSFI